MEMTLFEMGGDQSPIRTSNLEKLENYLEDCEGIESATIDKEYMDEEMTVYQLKRAVKKASEVVEKNTEKYTKLENATIWIRPEGLNKNNYQVTIEIDFLKEEDSNDILSLKTGELDVDEVVSFSNTGFWIKNFHRNQRYDFKMNKYRRGE